MRTLPVVVLVSLVVSALSSCSDSSVSPTTPLPITPPIAYSHLGDDPATSDLCDGLSPCDAYDYDRNLDGTPDGIVGVPGFCFLPPTVDNHLSDPACSGAFVPGLDLFTAA